MALTTDLRDHIEFNLLFYSWVNIYRGRSVIDLRLPETTNNA